MLLRVNLYLSHTAILMTKIKVALTLSPQTIITYEKP